MAIRVLIVDDQRLIRAGFRMLFQGASDVDVVGEAAGGQAGVEAAHRLRPDVVLMDLRMPDLDGASATRRIVSDPVQDARVIVLTTFDDEFDVIEALRAGASGFLLKDLGPDELIDAIRVVAAGGALLAPSVTRRLLDRFAQRLTVPGQEPGSDLGRLSERELEILRLLARGCSNREIADQLVLTEATVKSHVSHLLLKLDLRDRTQAVIAAYEAGLVRPGAIEATDPGPQRS
jgi:DNA-binding NarL/FixJ family response regulator